MDYCGIENDLLLTAMVAELALVADGRFVIDEGMHGKCELCAEKQQCEQQQRFSAQVVMHYRERPVIRGS